MSTTKRTLIYPGAGWDNKFYSVFKKKGYNHFILYDSLPEVKHYTPEQVGYPKQEMFLGVLKKNFGRCEHDESKSYMYFPEVNVEYYYNCDAGKITPPGGDILFKGYLCREWKDHFDGRIVFVNCCTYLNMSLFDLSDIVETHVHDGNGCRYDYCNSPYSSGEEELE
jgi:hypothetical protein